MCYHHYYFLLIFVTYWLIKNKEKKFGFAIDREEAFGNFIRDKYFHQVIEKVFEPTLINKIYRLGQKATLKRMDNEYIHSAKKIVAVNMETEE